MSVFCIANLKGGVGKSTTADALASFLLKLPRNNKVLAIDLDAQCNLTAAYGLNVFNGATTVRDVLRGGASPVDAVCLARAPIVRASQFLSVTDWGKVKPRDLKRLFSSFLADYDHIVIDTPTGLNPITVCALTASDCLILPTSADVFAVQGLGEMLRNVEAIRRENSGLMVGGVILSRHNPRSKLSQFWEEKITEVAESFGAPLLGAVRESVAVREAQTMGESLFDYAPTCNAAKDFEKAFQKLLQRIEVKNEKEI